MSLAALAPELTALFADAGFTADGIAAHLGPDATEALHRGEPAAVRYAAADDSTLSRLIRVFVLRDAVPATELAELLGATLATKLIDARAVTVDRSGTVRLVLDIRPHVIVGENRWVFSDADASMTEHVPGPDHVLGVGAASLSLLQSTPVTPVDTVLDLGTGSGVQALGQLGTAEQVTATDIHPRALELAAATFAGAGAQVELLQGAWFEPVAGRRFDRIVANPPFVVGLPEVGTSTATPASTSTVPPSFLPRRRSTSPRWYRASAGRVGAHPRAVLGGPRVLAASGAASRRGSSRRDVADPAHYVGTWLRRVRRPPPRGRRPHAGLAAHFADHGVTGIGSGSSPSGDGDEPPTSWRDHAAGLHRSPGLRSTSTSTASLAAHRSAGEL